MATHRTRLRRCIGCGSEKLIRADSPAVRCNSCSGKIGQAAGCTAKRAKAPRFSCRGCGEECSATASTIASRRYCSLACQREAQSDRRACETCGAGFRIARSHLAGNSTNSSGRFCSRKCYAISMVKPDKVTGRGSQWTQARMTAIRRNPFCAFCGTSKRLEVHHIMPYRLERDNDQSNLFPICHRHHRALEKITRQLEASAPSVPYEDALLARRCTLTQVQDVTRFRLMELRREIAC